MITFGNLTKEEVERFNKTIDENKDNKDIRLGDMEPHEVEPFLFVSDKEDKKNE